MPDVTQNPDISEAEWRWPHFSRAEMQCKGDGVCRMSPAFMDVLEAIRADFGAPLSVMSGYRSPDYNAKVSHTGLTGPHTLGLAIDIAIRGQDAHRLLKIALAHGITGIGVAQKGEGRFLHLDMVETGTRPWCWSY
jgi:zinc D-Ala-D-Ala carboxypeptidase